MKCKNCGYENPDTAKFCNECGEKLEPETVCPECGCKNKAGAKFCNECGYRFHKNNAHQTDVSTREQEYKTCSKCGGKNPKGTIMCRNCGNYLLLPPKPLSKNAPEEKPNNQNSARKCPNCGYEVGENDICDSCGYDVTKEKDVLAELVDTEKSEAILGNIDEIEKKKKRNDFSYFFILSGVVIVAICLFIAAYNIANEESEPEDYSNDIATYTDQQTNKTNTTSSSSSASNSGTKKITKDYKPIGSEPDWIEIVSYCEVQLPKIIGYEASISLYENDTTIIKTGLRYKIETDKLRIKPNNSYHKALFIIEFKDTTYNDFRIDTAEVDGVKFR